MFVRSLIGVYILLMTDIEPALTAEEWETRSIEGAGEHDGVLNVGDGFDSVTFSGASAVKLMALANASLSDDPRKITREDVEWLRLLAGNHTIDFNELQKWAEVLRARLAALLPP